MGVTSTGVSAIHLDTSLGQRMESNKAPFILRKVTDRSLSPMCLLQVFPCNMITRGHGYPPSPTSTSEPPPPQDP